MKAAAFPDAAEMVPEKMHCDFERDMMNTLAQELSGTVLGCYYHHCQVGKLLFFVI